MTRVVGIDPGTVSIDVCGMEDGQLYLDRSWPTGEALSDPTAFIELLTTRGRPEVIIGPSGYGLPLQRAAEATDNDLLLAFLAPADEPGGIGGLAGGANRPVVERLRIREARGTVLDNLLFVTPEAARRRLGIDGH